MLETLEDLRELRHRHARVDTEKMLQQNKAQGERLLQLQEEEDEAFVRLVNISLVILLLKLGDKAMMLFLWRQFLPSIAVAHTDAVLMMWTWLSPIFVMFSCARPQHSYSMCLSITCWSCIKTSDHCIFHLQVAQGLLVF